MTTKSFRILLAIWNNFPDLKFEQWDVKTAFVNAPLKETVFCHQVAGFEKVGTEGQVLRLRKALYGTKQAAVFVQNFVRFRSEKTPKRRMYLYFPRERERRKNRPLFVFRNSR